MIGVDGERNQVRRIVPPSNCIVDNRHRLETQFTVFTRRLAIFARVEFNPQRPDIRPQRECTRRSRTKNDFRMRRNRITTANTFQDYCAEVLFENCALPGSRSCYYPRNKIATRSDRLRLSELLIKRRCSHSEFH